MATRVYFYKGDETFLTNTKIIRLIKESKTDEYNITSYDCLEVNVEKAIFDALTPPFLSDRKVVIIRNPVFLESEKASNNHNCKLLINYLDSPMDNTCLIINAAGFKINEKLEVVKALNKKAIIITTNEISEIEFNGWLQRECETRGVKIYSSEIAMFYKAFGSDLEKAKNEIDKIITYIGGPGIVTKEICEVLMSKGSPNDIYNLTNAIFERNKEKLMNIYFELTRYEKDVSVLVNWITKSLKDNLLVKIMSENDLDLEQISQKMRTSVSRCRYLIRNAEVYSMEDIEKHIEKLASLDYKIKSGQIDKKIGFEEFLLSL